MLKPKVGEMPGRLGREKFSLYLETPERLGNSFRV